MKKLKLISTKILLLILAFIMPITMTGFVGFFFQPKDALADVAVNYIEPVTFTNSNFNYTTTTTLSQNPTNWTRQQATTNTTAGVINTDANYFNNRKNSTYYLANNPGAHASDTQILMINSKTSKDNSDENTNTYGNQSYKSGSITLNENSYYSFEVAFKSDSIYKTRNEYTLRGTDLNAPVNVSKSEFNSVNFSDDEPYISFTSGGRSYYVKKVLVEDAEPLASDFTSNLSFYADDEYVGVVIDQTTGNSKFIKLEDASAIEIGTKTNLYTDEKFETTETLESLLEETDPAITAGKLVLEKPNFEVYEDAPEYFTFQYDGLTCYISKSNVNYVFPSNTTTYKCESIEFTPSTITSGSAEEQTTRYSTTSGQYQISQTVNYYSRTTTSDNLNQYGLGSIYLDLNNSETNFTDGLAFEPVISKEWTSFYFFVATGNTSLSANLELTLGERSGNGSSGVVFFDNVEVWKYSPVDFYARYQEYLESKKLELDMSTPGLEEEPDTNIGTKTMSTVKFVSYVEDKSLTLPESLNFDFEKNDADNRINGWTRSQESTGRAKIVNVNSAEEFNSSNLGANYTSVGSNYLAKATLNGDGSLGKVTSGEKAMALAAQNQFIEVTSGDINISARQYYKIKAYYKISSLDGTAYFKVVEKMTDSVPADKYTLSQQSASITSNVTNNFTNNYGTVEFYVKGSSFYNSCINIVLSVGSSDAPATGCVVFDDITIEYSNYADYTAGGNKLALDPFSPQHSITNAKFDDAQNENENYPLAPADWTIEKEGFTFGGIINVKESEYEKYYESYLANQDLGNENPYLWAQGRGNPNSPGNKIDRNNNILMLANMNERAYQSVKSSTFTMTANSYYNLTFDYTTITRGTSDEHVSFKVSIYNESNILLYQAEDVYSELDWKTYSIYFQTSTAAENVFIQIEFGTKNGVGVAGYSYFDNFAIEQLELTADEFATIKETNNVSDLTNYYLNLGSNVITNNEKDFYSSAYTTSTNTNDNYGGIVTSSYIETRDDETEHVAPTFSEDSPFYLEDTDKYLFKITNNKAGTYTIQSNYSFDLAEESYYVLTFKLKTHFRYQNTSFDKDFDPTKYTYGANVGINADNSFKFMSNLVSNDDYETYTLYLHSTNEISGNLYISLTSANEGTCGTIVLYDLTFDKFDESNNEDIWEAYQAAITSVNGDNFDVNSSKVYVATQETPEDVESPDDSTDSETNTIGWEWLMYVGSIIFALAMIVAIVGYFLRKIKIKKIERKRKETYDRKGSLHRDVLRKEAEEERDKQAKDVEDVIKKFETELESLEKEHKEKVVSLRKENDAKATEKEFKQFAQKRSVISEKLNALNSQLENIKSPEYLLNIERRKYLEADAKQKLLKKESKKSAKTTTKKDEK